MRIEGGSRGKLFNDREKAAKVRNLALDHIYHWLKQKDLKDDDLKFQRDLLLKLAANTLPRLNEHTGDSGEPIRIEIAKEVADKYEIDTSPKDSS